MLRRLCRDSTQHRAQQLLHATAAEPGLVPAAHGGRLAVPAGLLLLGLGLGLCHDVANGILFMCVLTRGEGGREGGRGTGSGWHVRRAGRAVLGIANQSAD